MKKKIFALLTTVALLSSTMCAQAKTIGMWISDSYYVEREIESVNGFDMLPIFDIADELGIHVTWDGTTVWVWNNINSYTITIGDPAIYDQYGNVYGMDVVPQIINGKVMIQERFFREALNMTYFHSHVSNMILLNSSNPLGFLDSPSYQEMQAYQHALAYGVAQSFTSEKSNTDLSFNIPLEVDTHISDGKVIIPFDGADGYNVMKIYAEINDYQSPYQYLDQEWQYLAHLEGQDGYFPSLISGEYINIAGTTGYQLTYRLKYYPYIDYVGYSDTPEYETIRKIAFRHGNELYFIELRQNGWDFTELQSKTLDMICSSFIFQ